MKLIFNIMKALSVIFLFLILSFSSWSQDAILKRDGTKIDAKVVEITTTTIKYRNFDQPDGPIRNIAINDVQEIIYENGTWEKFEKRETTATVTEEKTESRPTKEPKDKIHGNGFFIEGMIGRNSIYQKNNYINYYYDEFGNYIEEPSPSRQNYVSLSVRLGNKWYFGSNEKWRPGIQVTYFKLGLYLNPNATNPGRNSISLGNVGFANAFKFNEKIGMEVNANVGFTAMNVLPPFFNNSPVAGLNYGLEVKFRYKALAVGLDYSRMQAAFNSSRYTSMDVMSITIGAKF